MVLLVFRPNLTAFYFWLEQGWGKAFKQVIWLWIPPFNERVPSQIICSKETQRMWLVFLLPWWERHSVFAVYYLLQLDDTLPTFIFWLEDRGLNSGLQGGILVRYFMFWARTFKPYSMLARITSNVSTIRHFYETLGNVSLAYFLFMVDTLRFNQIDRALQELGL